jgi:prevent-host-death family protein
MCYMAPQAPRSSVGVRELRQNLSVYLDRVKQGEVLTVTEHGTAVAVLHPLRGAESALDRLVAAGRARRPARSIRSLPKPLRVTLDRPLSALVNDDREDRL